MTQTQRYALLDAGDFQKLEQVGPYRIARPSPQAVWRKSLPASEWNRVDAVFTRFSGGDGSWEIRNKAIKNPWIIDQAGIKFVMKLTDFGHLGIFPEQKQNWDMLQTLVKNMKSKIPEVRVLNLFAYTGGSTLACAKGGAHVVHIDASKTSVDWARENAEASDAAQLPVRWIVEDVKKFVLREIKRGTKYQGIILDPPSYGRGNKNEVWKIETDLPELMDQLNQIFDEKMGFVLLSSHSTGYTPYALQNIMRQAMPSKQMQFESGEMVVPVEGQNMFLPSGTQAIMLRGEIDYPTHR